MSDRRTLERLTVNLTAAGKVRTDTLEGEEYLVVPCVMLAEGVHHGSHGPGYYPPDEMKKTAKAWNHMPIVVYHPEDGRSARDKVTLDTRGIGRLLNTRYDDKLKTEAWINKRRVKEVDERILTMLEAGQKVEVSTGLYLKKEKKKGEWNGEKYTFVARNHEPDHLAVLPDQIGAFSVKDGGGLLANERFKGDREFTDRERKRLVKNGYALPDGSFPVETEEDLKAGLKALKTATDKPAVRRHLIKRARELALTNALPKKWGVVGLAARPHTPLAFLPESLVQSFTRSVQNYLKSVGGELVGNDMSFSDITSRLCEALAATYGEKGKYWRGYVEQVYDDYVVFRKGYDDPSYWKVGYTLKDGVVSLTGDPVAVVRTTEYKAVGNATPAASPPTKETSMAFDKTTHVNSLIGNGWDEKDRKWLEAQDDEVLKKIQPAKTPESVPANNAAAKTPITMNDLPAELQQQVQEGLAYKKQRKDQLVEIITANKDNSLTKEYLANLDLPVLEGMARLAAPKPGDNYDGSSPFIPGTAPPYLGAIGAVPTHTPIQNAAPRPKAKGKPLGVPGREVPEASANGTAAAAK